MDMLAQCIHLSKHLSYRKNSNNRPYSNKRPLPGLDMENDNFFNIFQINTKL